MLEFASGEKLKVTNVSITAVIVIVSALSLQQDRLIEPLGRAVGAVVADVAVVVGVTSKRRVATSPARHRASHFLLADLSSPRDLAREQSSERQTVADIAVTCVGCDVTEPAHGFPAVVDVALNSGDGINLASC